MQTNQSILPLDVEDIVKQWRKTIQQSKKETQTSSIVSSKLIVFAWEYAKQQIIDLQQRFGCGSNQENDLEHIFVNKVAEIGYAILLGYTSDSILNGKSPVSLDHHGKDERVFVDTKYKDANKKRLLISGTKKFEFPVTSINSRFDQVILYVDSVYNGDRQSVSARIKNGSIKVTAIGVASVSCIAFHQSKQFYRGYSNSKTAFTGIQYLKHISVEAAEQRRYSQAVPKNVASIIKADKAGIDAKIEEIKAFLERDNNAKKSQTVDYEKLFENFLPEK